MISCSGRGTRCIESEDHNDRKAVVGEESLSRKYAEVRDGSGMGEVNEKERAVSRLRLYNGAVGMDANLSQRNSAGYCPEYEQYACRVQLLHVVVLET